jgi:hypothetical protein
MHVPRMPFAYALILCLLFLLPSAPAACSGAQRAPGLRAMAAAGSAVGQRRVFLPAVPVIRPLRLDLIGQTGGAMNALAVTDRFLYAGIGPRLAIFSLASPGKPLLVGLSEVLPGVVQAVAVHGAYAYVGLANAWAQVVDIRQPSRPRVLAAIPGLNAARLAVTSRYLIGGDRDLIVLDLARPDAPREIGSYRDWVYFDEGGLTDLNVFGAMVYAETPWGTLVIDISVPTAPQLERYVPDWRCCLAADQGYAYVRNFARPAVAVWRLDDPAAPLEVARIDACRYPADAVVDRRRLYLVCLGNAWEQLGAQLDVIDVSDPVHPFLRSALPLNAFGIAMASLSGRILHIVGDRGLTLVDLRQADKPRELLPVDTLTDITRLAAVGRQVIAADNTGRRLWKIDVTDHDRPFVYDVAPLPGLASRVLASDTAAYVAGEAHWVGGRSVTPSGYLSVFGPSRTGMFTELGRLTGIVPPTDIARTGNVIYALSNDHGARAIRIIDVSRAEAPRPVSGFANDDQSYYTTLAIDGGTLIVSSRLDWMGLKIFDINDPLHPVARGQLPIQEPRNAVVRGDMAYVGTRDQVIAVDITDLDHPRILSGQAAGTGETDSRMVLDGPLLYRASSCLAVDDLSDPARPVQIYGQYLGGSLYGQCLSGRVRDAAILDGDVMVAAGDAGLIVLRPASP